MENADITMNNFLAYRRANISPKHKNDNAQLITYVDTISDRDDLHPGKYSQSPDWLILMLGRVDCNSSRNSVGDIRR